MKYVSQSCDTNETVFAVKSNNNVRVESDSFCTDYASDCRMHATNMRNKDFVEGNPFVWTEKGGKLFLELTEFL